MPFPTSKYHVHLALHCIQAFTWPCTVARTSRGLALHLLLLLLLLLLLMLVLLLLLLLLQLLAL